MGRGVDISWVGGRYTIGRGSKFFKKKLKFKFQNLKIKKNIYNFKTQKFHKITKFSSYLKILIFK